MRQYRYGIHWLSFVVDGSRDRAFMLYDLFFKDLFGELQSMGHGGRGFQEIWYSLLGFKVYVFPSRGSLNTFILKSQVKLANKSIGKHFKVWMMY